jgi:hypothetical protein
MLSRGLHGHGELNFTAQRAHLETVKSSPAYCILKVMIGTAVPNAFRMISNASRIEPAYPKRPARPMEARASPLESRTARSMRQYERKSLLLLEWDRWLQTQPIDPLAPTARDTLKFFCELQDKRSPLLDFRPSRGDKWQVIHTWLRNEGRVSD